MAFSSEGMVHRPTVTGTRGMVASAHPLASLAGMRMLLEGGNAFDAVVAVAAALNVVEPYMSGIGGVGYALVREASKGTVRTLDYCGRTPLAASREALLDPATREGGLRSCLTPGACGGWLELLESCGRMDRASVFAPAIELADGGFAVTAKNAKFISDVVPRILPTGARVILAGGHAPLPGEILVQKDLARTFQRVVEGGREVFYRGDLGGEICRFVREEGGLLSEADLEGFDTEWVEPISTDYRGYEVICPPPPCSGFQILETLNMLEAHDLGAMGHLSEDALHLLIEACKLANADRVEYAAAESPPLEGLLSKAYARKRLELIGDRAAVGRGEYYRDDHLPGEVTPGTGADWVNECTTHFDVVDAEGNAAAITQSLGSGFGSGAILGQTGVFANNFLKWADVVPGSPNCVVPNKKIDMCLTPCQIHRDGRLVAALGTPGSWGIQQTTVQFMTNALDYGMNIQAAIEAPRFRLEFPGKRLHLEARVPASTHQALTQRGHEIDLVPEWSPTVGGAQGITVDPESGAMMGGADPRRDGYVLGL